MHVFGNPFDMPPACHSLPWRRFATPTVRTDLIQPVILNEVKRRERRSREEVLLEEIFSPPFFFLSS